MSSGNFTITLDPTSYADLQRKLRKLTDIEKTAVVQKGLSEAAGVIENAGRRNLRSSSLIHSPRLTGRKKNGKPLINSLTRKVDKKRASGYAGFKRPSGAAAHLLDKGTKDRYTKKGYYRGKITKDLFFTRAVEQNATKALNELKDSVEKSIKMIVNNR